MLPLPAFSPAIGACKPCYCTLSIVGSDMIHQDIKHLGWIILNYAHNTVRKTACMTIAHKINHRFGKRIIHYRVKLTAQQIPSSLAVSEFICGILPNLADNYSVFIFLLDSFSQIVKENIRELVSNVKSPAADTASEPFAQNAVPAANIIAVVFVLLDNFGKELYSPPGMVFIGPLDKFIPTVIFAFLAVVCSQRIIVAVHIKIFAVASCMAEYAVKNNGYAISLSSLAKAP